MATFQVEKINKFWQKYFIFHTFYEIVKTTFDEGHLQDSKFLNQFLFFLSFLVLLQLLVVMCLNYLYVLTGTQQIMACFTSAQQIVSMTGGRDQSNMSLLRDVWRQWTGKSNLGQFLLLIESLVILQTNITAWMVHLTSPWAGKACRSFGRSTRWILLSMVTSTTMKGLVPFTRYVLD